MNSNSPKSPSDNPTASELAELQQLREENAHLKALLAEHGISWNEKPEAVLEARTCVLSERTQHLELLREALGDDLENCFTLHGRLSKKHRKTVLSDIESLDDSTPRIILAIGRLISGKGSTMRLWTPWFWPCRSPGRARCGSMRADFTVSMLKNRTCASMIISNRTSPNWFECGISADAAIWPWATEFVFNSSQRQTIQLKSISRINLWRSCRVLMLNIQ